MPYMYVPKPNFVNSPFFFFFFLKKLYLYLNILDYKQIKLYIFATACDIPVQVLTAEFSGRIR